MSNIPRILHLPPAGRPRWISEGGAPGELQYLSWGWRIYERHPVPMSRHSGWIYQLLISGRAMADLGGERLCLRAGDLIIIDPGCPSGWSGAPGSERCKILTWIWRDPPLFASLRADVRGYKVFKVSSEAMKKLESLHQETRNEIKFPDEAVSQAVHSLRSRIDVSLVRMGGKHRVRSEAKSQLRYALSWLKSHPEDLRPVSSLSEYLQISPATLNRLFRRHLKKNVREIAYAGRMKVARRLLKQHFPVKEVAFQLGYSHSNDFTRAYSRFWKKSPSEGRTLPGSKAPSGKMLTVRSGIEK